MKMAIGKYLSLEEARKLNRLDRFCKEHPSKGDWNQFDNTLDAMAGPDAKSSVLTGNMNVRAPDRPPRL